MAAVTSQWNPRLDHAKRDRRRCDFRKKMLMKTYVVVRKNRESRCRQRQSGAAENRAVGLIARLCDVGLTFRHRRRSG